MMHERKEIWQNWNKISEFFCELTKGKSYCDACYLLIISLGLAREIFVPSKAPNISF